MTGREEDRGILKRHFCFVTQADLDREAAGGAIAEQKMLHILRKFGDAEVIYLQRKKRGSIWLALLLFNFEILKSFSKHHQIYFCRGLIASFLVLFLRLFRKRLKAVHRTVLPYASIEVKYLGYNNVEAFIRYSLFRFLEKVVLPRVDAVCIPFSEYTNDLQVMGVKKDKIYVVRHPYVEEDFFKPPIKKTLDENFKICSVSGFHLYHDLFVLIDAFEIFTESEKGPELFLVGDGVLRPHLERKVAEKNLAKRVKFAGKIPHLAVPLFLSKMDAFVSVSRTPAISGSLVEAAAAGKAIITVKKNEDTTTNRYFRHGVEAYVVNSFSSAEIAQAMRSLYHDSQLRITLATKAREAAQRHFTQDVALQQLSVLLNEICRGSIG